MTTFKTDFEKQPQIILKMTNEPKYKGSKNYNKDLLDFIKTSKPSEWSNIQSSINAKYSDLIFILKKGELENYIDKSVTNKVENAIKFCKNDFTVWYINNAKQSEVQELQQIFKNIV